MSGWKNRITRLLQRRSMPVHHAPRRDEQPLIGYYRRRAPLPTVFLCPEHPPTLPDWHDIRWGDVMDQQEGTPLEGMPTGLHPPVCGVCGVDLRDVDPLT